MAVKTKKWQKKFLVSQDFNLKTHIRKQHEGKRIPEDTTEEQEMSCIHSFIVKVEDDSEEEDSDTEDEV